MLESLKRKFHIEGRGKDEISPSICLTALRSLANKFWKDENGNFDVEMAAKLANAAIYVFLGGALLYCCTGALFAFGAEHETGPFYLTPVPSAAPATPQPTRDLLRGDCPSPSCYSITETFTRKNSAGVTIVMVYHNQAVSLGVYDPVKSDATGCTCVK